MLNKDNGYFGIIVTDFDESGNATGNFRRKPFFCALQNVSSVFSEEYSTVRATTVSFTFLTHNTDFKIVDLMNGDVYELPEGMAAKVSENHYKFEHLPAKDTSVAIVCGSFCDWSRI